MRRIIYSILGILCVIVGMIGILIPVLPTTPLLLSAAWFFARSSDRFHRWLLYHPVMGEYIRDYVEKKGIKKKVRKRAIMILWTSMLLTMLIVQRSVVTGILSTIGALVTLYIFSLRVLPPAPPEEQPDGA